MDDEQDRPVSPYARLVEDLHASLDRADYYTMLGVPRFADYVRIREAFFERAQTVHPDRFVVSPDARLRRKAYEVFKRITEAYNVLGDPVLRRRYDTSRRTGVVRLPPHERSRRLDAQERAVANPVARIYLRAARAKLARGDLAGARLDVALGMSLDEAEPLVALRDRILRAMGGQVQS